MNKKALLPALAIAGAVLVILSVTAMTGPWQDLDPAEEQPFGPDPSGTLPTDSINYQLFENFGPVLLVLAILMFGAMIGGVHIAKEDDEDDSD